MNNKVGFRMWKSGKQWLFSGVALMASLVMGTAAITANSYGGCQSVIGLRSQDQDTHQCVLWYPGTQTLSGSNGDRELPGFGGENTGASAHITWGPAAPTLSGSNGDRELPGFGGENTGENTGASAHITWGPAAPTLSGSEAVRKHKDRSSESKNMLQSKSTSTSPVTILSATGVMILIAVGAFSIKKIWKK
ncbi:KxYKxGKxW signal peptide domain-containing protein [Streptococcus halichoeri]|uniref:KxYKxGKxW signal peptide domain-containing protein n=1 Tax=Streptococcus halichoeri TaxID=254785 RepID=UPI001359BE5F|nr:KxYKxGKxW signal peptide domain-containing protein [Streptococcus halichoeri]